MVHGIVRLEDTVVKCGARPGRASAEFKAPQHRHISIDRAIHACVHDEVRLPRPIKARRIQPSRLVKGAIIQMTTVGES